MLSQQELVYGMGRREATRASRAGGREGGRGAALSVLAVSHWSRGGGRELGAGRERVGPAVQGGGAGWGDRAGPLTAVRVVGGARAQTSTRGGCGACGEVKIRGEEVTDAPLSSRHRPAGPPRLRQRRRGWL